MPPASHSSLNERTVNDDCRKHSSPDVKQQLPSGVWYDRVENRYVVQCKETTACGRKKRKYFGVSRYGDEVARNFAIAARSLIMGGTPADSGPLQIPGAESPLFSSSNVVSPSDVFSSSCTSPPSSASGSPLSSAEPENEFLSSPNGLPSLLGSSSMTRKTRSRRRRSAKMETLEDSGMQKSRQPPAQTLPQETSTTDENMEPLSVTPFQEVPKTEIGNEEESMSNCIRNSIETYLHSVQRK